MNKQQNYKTENVLTNHQISAMQQAMNGNQVGKVKIRPMTPYDKNKKKNGYQNKADSYVQLYLVTFEIVGGEMNGEIKHMKIIAYGMKKAQDAVNTYADKNGIKAANTDIQLIKRIPHRGFMILEDDCV